MSIFSNLSQAFKGAKPTKSKPVTRKPKPLKKAPQVSQKQIQAVIAQAKAQAQAQAKAQAQEIILQAREQALKIKQQQETKSRELFAKEATLNSQSSIIKQRLQEADTKAKQTELQLQQVQKTKLKQLEKLQKIATLTTQEAKEILLKTLDTEIAEDQAKRLRAAEEKANEQADSKAQDILVDAMRHGATDYVAEFTVSTIKLPDDDVKGRIIGKEGRNIRAFERATGVDLDMDETPGEVRLSSFDSVRREIARVALTRLIADGRIQPSRIDEYVKTATHEVSRIMFEAGNKLAHSVGVYNLPRDLLEILGRFKFRSSYGQNMIAHTLEETKIGIALPQEAKADVNTVRLGCLLHDIGKVVTGQEGSHVELGVKLLKKYNIPQPVIDCVAQHHQDIPFTSNEAVLVYIADAISGARPGARFEDYEEYVNRLKNLEELANSFDGIKEAFAIQAGREVRVMVNPEQISDAQAVKLAHHLKNKIQKEMTYPGTVKVNVIRETRATETAT